MSNVASDCEVERKTVEGYIGILEDLQLAFRLPVFSRHAKRALIKHSKFYFYDTGVFRSLRPSGPLDKAGETEGQALEGLVAQHLRAWIAYRGDKDKLFFWRTRGGSEVDFVVYGPDTFFAIEVKNAGKCRPSDLNGLTAFKEDYREAKAALLYRGEERLMIRDVLCMPCAEFLSRLTPEKDINCAIEGSINSA